jgi:hypothetical protein
MLKITTQEVNLFLLCLCLRLLYLIMQTDNSPLRHAAQYLKNSVTLESKSDEKRRESIITDRAHPNDHGGKHAEAEFWEKHRKDNRTPEHGHGHGHTKHGHAEATNEPVGHVTAKNAKEKSGGPVTGTLL